MKISKLRKLLKKRHKQFKEENNCKDGPIYVQAPDQKVYHISKVHLMIGGKLEIELAKEPVSPEAYTTPLKADKAVEKVK